MLGGAARGLADEGIRWSGSGRSGASGPGDPAQPGPPGEQARPAGGGGWLSLDEKAALTGGADMWHTVAIDRLGIPAARLSSGTSAARGLRFSADRSVVVPCGSALGATWNRDLVQRVGRLLGDQARESHGDVLLAPNVNLHRHPLSGRSFESFSEDPYLTAQLAVAYVRGVQEQGVGCAVKHFVANEQEHERMDISAEADERTLRELYLLPFEAVVRSAGVWAVTTAYNRLHGVHCSEHAGLLQGILRGEWEFDGLVMSDWWGTYSTVALDAGLDLEMPGPPRFLGRFAAAAVRQGDLDESVLDRAAQHVLRLVDRVSARATQAGDSPAGGHDAEPDARADHDAEAETDVQAGDDTAGAEAGLHVPAEVARQAACEAIVVLRNEGVLPLAPEHRDVGAGNGDSSDRPLTVAVLGPKATRPDIQGRGGSYITPPYQVTPLDGIRRRAEAAGTAVTVVHELGVAQPAGTPLDAHELRLPGSDEPGALIEYFAGPCIEGTPIHHEVVPETRLFWLGPPAPGVPVQPGRGGFAASMRLTADVVVDRSGPWGFILTSAGRVRVRLDDDVLIDNLAPERGKSFFGQGSDEVRGQAELTAGTVHRLVVEIHVEARATAWLSGLVLLAQPPPDPDALLRAVATAREADVAVVVVGRSAPDTEGADRRSMDLPSGQTALIQAVADANPATVVVLDTAGPVAMDWVDDVGAVVQLGYLGQETGAALADVLFGDVDPSGRLPTSFPRRLEDTPAHPYYPGVEGRTRYGEGLLMGYRHYDTRHVEPLFCFGHGLSYTRFAYGEPGVELVEAGAGGEGGTDPLDDPVLVRVRVDVCNVGDRPGSEVVQLYVRDVSASVARPEQELKQFAKVHLAPGATETVQLDLPWRAFAFWDATHHDWTVEPGEFELRLGSSSRRIHRTATVTLP